MILVIVTLLVALLNFLVTGYLTLAAIRYCSKGGASYGTPEWDELIFTGFAVISVITGFISIWFPVGTMILIIWSIISSFLIIIKRKYFRQLADSFWSGFRSFRKPELFFILSIVILVLMALACRITLGDTESYHAQSIQWVRKFAVVPGLGNIHGRLAFNSMFFVVSGMFTFRIGEVLIFPINGLLYLALSLKLAILAVREFKENAIWQSLFFMLLLLISLFILLPDLNSPAPDIICSIFILYLFAILAGSYFRKEEPDFIRVILINLLVFTTVSFKLSSLFILLLLPLVMKRDFFKKALLSVMLGVVILSPYLIRNYYLSGYVVYPYPEVDIFDVDWKIPAEEVSAMKGEIGAWARVSIVPYQEVEKMKIAEWSPLWLKGLNSNSRIILAVNLLSVAALVIMIFRKNFWFAALQAVILANLIFWFVMAPDPRFAYGFLFAGFALTVSYLAGLTLNRNPDLFYRISRVGLLLFLILIFGRRFATPVEVIRSPRLLVIPAAFGKVETRELNSGFSYRVPIPEGGCFDSEIPCVPYPLQNIEPRGRDLQSGFKVKK